MNDYEDDDECDAASAGGEEEDGVGAGEEVEVELEQQDESRKSKERPPPAAAAAAAAGVAGKRPKKRNSNVWSKSTWRKSSKEGGAPKTAAGVCSADGANGSGGNNGGGRADPAAGERVLPKVDNGPELPVMLSKIHRAEKVELSADRMTAGSCKGYRMVKATRGVLQGRLGKRSHADRIPRVPERRPSGCTSRDECDQCHRGAPPSSPSTRLDGSKVHSAWREAYAEAYAEGDTIGYLPNAAALAPKPPELVTFMREEPLKPLPGSRTYFPAASMYTLANKDHCTVRFNFALGLGRTCGTSSHVQRSLVA